MDIKGFVGVDYWGDKNYADFKKTFAKKIRPDEMKAQWELVKKAYKGAHPIK